MTTLPPVAAAALVRIDREMQALRAKLRQVETAGGGAGSPGADGKTVLNGIGAPAAGLGANGDFYIDTAADAIYGPKTAGAWGSATSLIGPAGPNGTNGTNGTNGATGSTGAPGADGADGTDGANGADGLSMGQTLFAPAAGVFLSNGPLANTLSTAAQVADRVTIAPFVVRHAITIDQLGCSISTIVAGATVKLVIYDSDAQGRPTTILRETAAIDANSTAATRFAAIAALTLQPGKIYWLGLRSSSTATIRTVNAAAAFVLSSTNAATPVQQTSLTKTETYATAAANWTYAAAQHSNLGPPLILMRVA